MNKKVSISLLICVVLIAMTVTFSLTMVMAMRMFDSTVASVKEKESMYAKLAEIDRYIRDNDYYPTDEDTLNDMLASGYMLGSGDKYARYYTAAAYAELVQIQNGTQMGIGVEAVKDGNTGYAKVIKVYSGSPAEDLGITVGCYITAIDDVDVKNLSSSDSIASRLRGENGTTVSVTWRNLMAEESTNTITRRSYAVTTVESQLIGGNCGYIRIRSFAEDTASELDFAINTMKAQGAQSLIFDLRDNTGGSLDAAIECIDLICPGGTIASAEYRDGTVKQLGRSGSSSQVTLPIVCLVNGSTASGAELFAASARSLNGARLVGTATAGKGTLQAEPKLLSDGSAVVITVARLLCGDGSCFDGVGLAVDAERALSSDEESAYYDFTPETDPQVLRAFTVANTLTGKGTVSAVTEADSAASSETTDEASSETGDEAASETADSAASSGAADSASSAASSGAGSSSAAA